MQTIVAVFTVSAVGVVLLFVLFSAWDDLRNLLNRAINMIQSVSDYVTAMRGRIANLETVEESVKTLLSSQFAQLTAIRAQLANAGVTPADLANLDGFLTTLDTDTTGLSDAVKASTVAADEPPPAPAPEVVPLAVTTTALPDAIAGQGYTGNIAIEGGSGPYEVLSSPPTDNGITINGDGTVGGTAIAEGDSEFMLTVKDSADPQQTVTAPVTLHTDRAA